MRKVKQKKEQEKNNYLEDFEEPEDRVLQNITETDIANHNNLMLSGNSNTDYDVLQEVWIRWDREHDFSEKVQTYDVGTDFKQIGENFTNYLETRISRRVVRRNVLPHTLKPSQKLAHDVLVRMATR